MLCSKKFLQRIEVVLLLKVSWVLCPVCGNKTRLNVREDTELENFPLFCPKCKQINRLSPL